MASLVFATRRRRGDHELGDPLHVVPVATPRAAEHQDVVGRHQRGEARAARCERAQQGPGSTLRREYTTQPAPQYANAPRIQRVGVAHRHHQQRSVAAAEPISASGRERGCAARWLRTRSLRACRGADVYIRVQGSAGSTGAAGSLRGPRQAGLHRRDIRRAFVGAESE